MQRLSQLLVFGEIPALLAFLRRHGSRKGGVRPDCAEKIQPPALSVKHIDRRRVRSCRPHHVLKRRVQLRSQRHRAPLM